MPNELPLAISFAISALLSPLLRRLALRAGLLDRPNERSSHVTPTPRNGGIAILVAIGVVMLLLAFNPAPTGPAHWMLLIGMAVLAVVGYIDDVRSLSALIRFGMHTLVAAAFLLAVRLGSVPLTIVPGIEMQFGLIASIIVAIWLVGFTNAFNFMDGINGIAAGHAIVAGLTFGFLASGQGESALSTLMYALAGAAAGFLVWNVFGRIFMGDVGSGAIGFCIAASVVFLASRGVPLVLLLLPLSPFILDTSITLFRRIVRGEKWYTAHRSHFYQRLTVLGWPHPAVSGLWTGMAAIGGVVAVRFQTDFVFPAVALLVFEVGIGLAISYAEWKRKSIALRVH